MDIFGILLAAGQGRRFDPSGSHNKLLAPLPDNTPVVVAAAEAMLAVLPRVVAVVQDANGAVAVALRSLGCDVVPCPDAHLGMSASLVRGLHQCQSADAWVISLGDMPFVQSTTIAALCEAVLQGATIAAPFHKGRRGNPVALQKIYLEQLLALQGDRGARAILDGNPVTAVTVIDTGIFRDVDMPTDLKEY